MPSKKFATYSEFWPFYLGEHSVPLCRALHFVGSSIVLAVGATAVLYQKPMLLFAMPFAGYGFAWVGHFFVEHNKPASFKAPLYSLVSDFRMWAIMATGRLWRGTNPAQQLGIASSPAAAE